MRSPTDARDARHMCGIAGTLHFDGRDADPAALRAMLEPILHRGPDGAGVLTDGPAGLAHVRLSIVDIAGGGQPMSTPDGRLSITFNGEIFNFPELRRELSLRGRRFRSRSDTEVILHAYEEWGADCVRHMNGQWAFAIWDARRRELFLSRDRMGIRPLFYTTAAGTFLFASEVKALFTHAAVPRKLDLRGLAQIFTFWATVAPRTAFDGVRQLPPGHSMVVRDGAIRIHKYWDLDFTPDAAPHKSDAEYAHELWDLLVDATRLRLRADVPVATYVSGGLDSSAIAAAVKTVTGAAADAFSVSFDDAEFDEGPFQQEVTAHLGARAHGIRCDDADISHLFPQVIRYAETPLIRTAPAPLLSLSALTRSHGYKVVLTGEGADETLGGYDLFKECKLRAWCARQPDSRLRPLLLRRLYPYMPLLQRQPDVALRAFFHGATDPHTDPFFSHRLRWETTSRLQALFSEETRTALRDYDPYEELSCRLPDAFTADWSPLARAQFLECRILLPGYILSSQGDRMAMANGVEIRMPFLDYRLVEFTGRLPDRLKIKVLDEKYLLKQCAAAHLPARVVRRPKQPYRAPDGRCFVARDAPPPVAAALLPAAVDAHGIFNGAAVDALRQKCAGQRATGLRDNMGLVGVLSTELLIEQFIDDFQTETATDADRAAVAALHR